MIHLVLDSSAAVEYLLWTPLGQRVAARIDGPGIIALHVPHIFSVEVTSALRGLVLGGGVAHHRARQALEDLAVIAVQRYPVEPHLPRIWSLRANLTTYDATYVALTESIGATLVTADRKFDTPTVRRLIDVEVIR